MRVKPQCQKDMLQFFYRKKRHLLARVHLEAGRGPLLPTYYGQIQIIFDNKSRSECHHLHIGKLQSEKVSELQFDRSLLIASETIRTFPGPPFICIPKYVE
jgi:hypothetical protein